MADSLIEAGAGGSCLAGGRMTDSELSQLRPVRGQNFYEADSSLRRLVAVYTASSQRPVIEKQLLDFAAPVSDRWDGLIEAAALDYQGPKIEAYDRQGRSCDSIWLPPPVRTVRREVVEAGIFDNQCLVEQFAKVYLLGHLGEGSLVCPLACTEGLIRAIEAVGSEFLRETYLPKIRSVETPLAGAQFVTEQDMGSDIGALKTRAVEVGEGRWQLTGEKWFCSAIDEYFLIAARPDGAAEGTRGVAVYLVPRLLDGTVNGIHIKRLKNKLGTRELPTAEIDLEGAVAFNIGPIEQGFKTLMNYVINTSRIMNGASALGFMARASLEAQNYAEQRSAFGRKIIQYPMVQESLLRIRAVLEARRALYFYLLARRDEKPLTDLGSDEAYGQRFLINLCKYRTALGATECTREAILQLGGNGIVESFSILPRLYRDSLIIETWEGTHNTLALQICRDGLRFPFKDWVEDVLGVWQSHLSETSFEEIRQWTQDRWQGMLPLFDKLQDVDWVSRHARHFIDYLGDTLETACLAHVLAQQDIDRKDIEPLHFYRHTRQSPREL